MTGIKAIETYYNGYRFRSRLEARWAFFFDAVGIRYDYEPEGFRLKNGMYYLPDFYLPDFKLWVEVKGVFDADSKIKVDLFAETLKWDSERIWILREIPNPDHYWGAWENELSEDAFWVFARTAADGPYLPCICPACGKVGIEYSGRGWRVDDCTQDADTIVYPEAGCFFHEDKGYSAGAPKILNAYRLARSARFEHGEKPKA